MKRFVDLIISKGQSLLRRDTLCKQARDRCKEETSCANCAVRELMYIITQESRKYNNGWIPIRRRLPSEAECTAYENRFLVHNGVRTYEAIFNCKSRKFGILSMNVTFYPDIKVTHWQLLPLKPETSDKYICTSQLSVAKYDEDDQPTDELGTVPPGSVWEYEHNSISESDFRLNWVGGADCEFTYLDVSEATLCDYFAIL